MTNNNRSEISLDTGFLFDYELVQLQLVRCFIVWHVAALSVFII